MLQEIDQLLTVLYFSKEKNNNGIIDPKQFKTDFEKTYPNVNFEKVRNVAEHNFDIYFTDFHVWINFGNNVATYYDVINVLTENVFV